MKPIDILVEKLNTFEDIEKKLSLELRLLIATTANDVNKNYDKSYCMRLIVPEKEMARIMNKYDISLKDLEQAFQAQWMLPNNAKMHLDTYYHGTMLIYLFALKRKNEELAKNALSLLLFRIWNGRITGGIKYCDPDTMKYVINVMMNNKFEAHKHATPYDLIINYFTPTIHEKYKNDLAADSTKSKQVFEQCYSRIRQILRSSKITNLKTETATYASGIQSFYYKAKEKGLKISSVRSGGGEMSADQLFSSSSNEEYVQEVLNYIIMNISPNYQEEVKFLKKIKELIGSNIKEDKFIQFVSFIHSVKFSGILEEILETMFKKLQNTSKQDICSHEFLDLVIQRKIISSKKNEDTVHLKKLVDKLITDILRDEYKQEFESNSEPVKISMRKMIIYTISYNIQKKLC